MTNGYSPITDNNLTALPIGGSSSLYKIGYDATVEIVRVKPLDAINVSFEGKEYVVDWNKFIKDYCTEV